MHQNTAEVFAGDIVACGCCVVLILGSYLELGDSRAGHNHTVADSGCGGGNNQLGKTCNIGKCLCADTFETFGKDKTSAEAGAGESHFADIGQCGGEVDFADCGVLESESVDSINGAAQSYLAQFLGVGEEGRGNCGETFGKSDFLDGGICEHTGAKGFHIALENNGFQGGAVLEIAGVQFRHASAENHFLKSRSSAERLVGHGCGLSRIDGVIDIQLAQRAGAAIDKGVGVHVEQSVAVEDCEFSQRGAAFEEGAGNLGDAAGDCYLCKRSTVGEHVLLQLCDTGGKSDRCKLGAILERTETNLGDGVGHYHRGHRLALECLAAEFGNGVGLAFVFDVLGKYDIAAVVFGKCSVFGNRLLLGSKTLNSKPITGGLVDNALVKEGLCRHAQAKKHEHPCGKSRPLGSKVVHGYDNYGFGVSWFKIRLFLRYVVSAAMVPHGKIVGKFKHYYLVRQIFFHA